MNNKPNHDRVAHGGKAIYGAALGILMLEAKFPRIPGDMGNAETWPFPVLYKVVKGASPERVGRERANGLLDAFLEGARELVDLGADGITTNCGFLSLFQDEIARHVGVPVATSSLMQAPMIARVLPAGRWAHAPGPPSTFRPPGPASTRPSPAPTKDASSPAPSWATSRRSMSRRRSATSSRPGRR